MGPSTSRSLSYSSSNSSLIGTGQINRIKKRKPKLNVVNVPASVKKGRVSTATFQKKLVVFHYMGVDGPDAFTRADKRIAMRGLLPPIPVDASESDVRREICDVIRSCSDYAECSPNDFQFIDMNGKQASIPNCKAGFLWDGRAVKELAGSGCLYVRFTSDFRGSSDSSSSEERKLPNISVTRRRDDDVLIVKETPGTSASALAHQYVAAGSESSHHLPDSESPCTSAGIQSPHVCGRDQSNQSSSSAAMLPTSTPSSPSSMLSDTDDTHVPPAFSVVHEKPDETRDLARLTEIFSNLTAEQLKYVYSLPTQNKFDSTVTCLMEGPTLEALRSLAVTQLVIPLSESPCIRVDADADDEEMVGAALAYYKHNRFNKAAYVKVSMRRQPGIDTGGIRRQFFAIVFSEIAMSRSIQVFDGPVNRLRPSFRASNLSSGLVSTIGTMIAHSLLMDGIAFPYLSEYCYYYIAGYLDKALTCITIDDVGEQVKLVVDQVELIDRDEDIVNFPLMDDLNEMMDKSGCDVVLTVSNKKAVVECLMVYDALHKRSAYMDAFAQGLEVLGVKTLLNMFPEECKKAFVWDGRVRPYEVASKMSPVPTIEDMLPAQKKVWGYLMNFIENAKEEDLKAFIQFITGSPVPVGTIIVHFTSHAAAEGIVANTCGRQLTLSTLIEEEDAFVSAMLAVIPGRRYTMP